ncbi:MAG: S8 family peptidase, partial [Prolixibacteraceae bacterium]|nr:S8 family peptidase [Prolixibacteraceae bacterium]
IIAPSDGDCVIGVGAVNKDGQAAYFTSYGPASDGDIKPNLSAVGWNTFLQKADGTLDYSSGTSFASPVMAGMGTCLWQANPQATATQIKQALEQSANLYNSPDSLLGFGIPDMKIADQILKTLTVKQLKTTNNWLVYPNPLTDLIVIQQNNKSVTGEVKIEIFSIDGKLLQNWVKLASSKIILRNIRNLPAGILLLKISDSAFSETIKLNKIF